MTGVQTCALPILFSHDLYDQEFPAQIPHLVQMLDGKADDTLQFRLRDIRDPPVSNMLPEKHAEVWRRHGRGFVYVSQVYQRERSVCADQKAFLSLWCLHGDQKLVRLRLDDAGDPSV